jgi:carboxyl-terminal processing protease
MTIDNMITEEKQREGGENEENKSMEDKIVFNNKSSNKPSFDDSFYTNKKFKKDGNSEGIFKGFGYHLLAIVILTGVFYLGVGWGKHLSAPVVATNDVTDFIQRLSNPKDIFARDPEAGKPEKIDFNIFWDVWKKVDQNYVSQDTVKDTKKRVYGAAKGMVAALGDPYSNFFDPEESEEFNTELDGKFTGIGAELTIQDGILTIVAPIEGMPAEKAGLLAGDKIIKVNDELTSDMTIEDAVKKIRGEKGTEVVLTVLHKGAKETDEIKIIRDEIDIKSVVYEKKSGNIGYVRIKGFMDDTAKEFDEVVSKILADGDKGLIVDVRSNPGGNLQVAIDVISKFIPKGEVVLWERDRNNKETAYRAIGGEELKNIPVVVLIDGGSASASEILAGALRDDRQSLLIGEKSFGKGSVQSLEPLRDGSSLKITIAKWLTPSKQSIHEIGIEPTIEVKLTLDDIKNKNDKQLKRAMEEIKKQIQ